MANKHKKNSCSMLNQQEIIAAYGVTKRIIDKYFPKPVVRQKPLRNGKWSYRRYWTRAEVEQALAAPALREELEKLKDQRKHEQQIIAAREMLSAYNPESMIKSGRALKRFFVLHVGPTNSGKTYDAVEALKRSSSGTYLGPLRLLALEMFDKINAEGIPCSLQTGEETIPVEGAAIVSSTIELCDYHRKFDVAVIDEAQLITDSDRGAAWFRAICEVNAEEVHICLAPEALTIIEGLVKEFGDPYNVVTHERLVPLKYGGVCRGFKDIRPNDAVICFSRKNVLSTAALLEQNGFKASVIYGALPPVARRNEVERYLSGETNVIVATDAIGLGISLPIRRVIFAETQKFDGRERRSLTPSEVRQIAGRAGRYRMFDHGEVLTMDSTEIISRGMSNTPKAVRSLCIAFPREVLDSEYPLDVLLRAWQSIADSRSFRREDMSDALMLYSVLKGSIHTDNRQLVFDLISCPIDSNSQELIGYWADCARAILKKKHIPRPKFGTETLQDCELQYKAYDILHQLMMRIGRPAEYAEERDAICQRIKELMQADKSSYIRRCSCCGKELPIGYAFNLCEKCYNMA